MHFSEITQGGVYMKSVVHSTITIITAIVLCESVGIAGGKISSEAISEWYRTLKKPSINPPSWIFGPVWTLLYAMMGWSVAIIWKNKVGRERISAHLAFGVQLCLNFLWTVLFFGMRNPFAAFVNIVFLLLSIVVTMITFWRVSKKASLLLVPYLLWVSFASVLNWFLWRLNSK